MAKDKTITVTQIQEIPYIPPTPKKRGRPATGMARSNAQRQSAFRLEKKIAVASCDIRDFPVVSDFVLLARLKESIKSINATDLSDEDINTAHFIFTKLITELNKRYSNVI